MPLGSSNLEIRLAALMTRLIGESNLESRTELGSSGNFRFTNGAGALQADAVIDASIACNNSAVAFSTFTRIDGNAFGSATELKAMILFNPSTNANAVITCSVSGAAVGTLHPGGIMVWVSPTAGGLTISGSSTITSNGGGASQFVRAILFVS
jgi:hypothetical protein